MPSEVYLSAVELYRVRPGEPVFLTVTIGQAQIGSTTLEWDGQAISEPSYERYRIGGDGDDLCGRRLGLLTKVYDVNPATNLTHVTYALSGGQEEREFPFRIEVAGTGGFATYNIDFILV